MRDKTNAFAIWSFNPLERFEQGMLRIQRYTLNCTKFYMSYWRLISRTDSRNIRARILHRLSDIMNSLNHQVMNNALNVWADPTRRNKIYNALVLFAKKLD